MARKEKFVTNAVKVALPIDVTFAEGPFVQDADGNVYVDLVGGIGVQTAGHRPPPVIRAAKDELGRLTHISVMVATYAPYTDLAAQMAEICPPGLTKSIFLNSGSEAIENAVKISRAATKRAWLVSFKTAFHGRTLLDISLTGKDKPYREGFGPLVREVILADYAYPYRDPQGLPPAECAKARVEEIERAINQPEVAGRVAAILAEPVQGEGGMIVPPKEFFPLLRKLCDAHGIALVDDEVQAGMGRTGKLWAREHWNTVPGFLVSGKAVGGGLPFGGVTGRRAGRPARRAQERTRAPYGGILQQLHPPAPADQHPAPAHDESARPARRQSRSGSCREGVLRWGWSARPNCSRKSSPTTGI